jgi:hypothetical protein
MFMPLIATVSVSSTESTVLFVSTCTMLMLAAAMPFCAVAIEVEITNRNPATVRAKVRKIMIWKLCGR